MFGARHGFKVCTGAHYLGGYIGDDESKHNWLRERTLTWEKNISKTRKPAGKYPQESYAKVVCSIQPEWIFLQRVTWDTGDTFAGVERIIWEIFLPCLFFGNTKTLYPVVGALSTMPFKKFGMGLLNPVTSSQEKYLSYHQGKAELFWDVTGGGEFYNADHLRTLSEERLDGKKDQDDAYKSKLKGLVRDLKGTDRRLLLSAKSTGSWLSIRGTAVSGTVLSAMEFWGFYVHIITSLLLTSRATVMDMAQRSE